MALSEMEILSAEDAEQRFRANEQIARGQEQARRRKLSDLQASPEGQAFMQRESERTAMEQYLRANPGLAQQIMKKRVEQSYSPTPGPIVQTETGIYERTPRGLVPLREPGTGTPLKPKGTEKPITEFQGKNALYGSRAMMSDQILTNLEEKINQPMLSMKQSAQQIPLIGGALGYAGNLALSANQQKVEQAQRNFVNAVLRQESGAVISDSEFENAKKQYFAQPGDTTEVVAQKRANRKLAIQGFKKIAGKAWTDAEEQVGQAAPLVEGFKDADKEKRYQEWKAKQK